MILELIQSDYYEEIGKTIFAKDLREDNNEDLDWIWESRYRIVGVGVVGYVGVGFVVDVGGFVVGVGFVVDVGGIGGMFTVGGVFRGDVNNGFINNILK